MVRGAGGRGGRRIREGRAGVESEDRENREDEAADAPAHLSDGEINVIVVGDTDLLQDQFWVQRQNLFGQSLPIPISANGSLVVNALDNLTGSGDLIGIRSGDGSCARSRS